jgi:UDP-glucose 4-epimerase
MNQRILVTGGQGLIGRSLAARASAQGLKVRISTRRKFIATDFPLEYFQTTDLGPATDWSTPLQGIDTVVHCAARVHVMRETEVEPLAAFRAANVRGTLNLAQQAAAAKVRRFVFISSVKVNGERTKAGQTFTEADAPDPRDAYGISKHEAELSLRQLASATGMEVVIIRPPLVYGPGVKANFLALMRWLWRGIPLPLGVIRNKRSFVALDNLIDLIVTCIEHPAAANQTFLVSDGEDLSTSDLLRRMAVALNVPARLLPLPQILIEVGFKMVRKNDLAQRLCSSLQLDISKARTLLSWNPPISVDEGLHRTAQWFLHEKVI